MKLGSYRNVIYTSHQLRRHRHRHHDHAAVFKLL